MSGMQKKIFIAMLFEKHIRKQIQKIYEFANIYAVRTLSIPNLLHFMNAYIFPVRFVIKYI